MKRTLSEKLYTGSQVQSSSGCDGRLFIVCMLTRPLIIFSVRNLYWEKTQITCKTVVLDSYEIKHYLLQSLGVSSQHWKNTVPKSSFLYLVKNTYFYYGGKRPWHTVSLSFGLWTWSISQLLMPVFKGLVYRSLKHLTSYSKSWEQFPNTERTICIKPRPSTLYDTYIFYIEIRPVPQCERPSHQLPQL